ncbi:hypothetical protein [Haloplanus aerogenes]|uniref:Uncharacterized protein n=1 Tax=Haloplanus aerogenes TaxID=660522 RepID=A0A3M0DBG1_9EURY|nr:hypothetical protein [Haloplanus aerogenes]AZH23924.1 hypothetical protein DU502_00390 [Haloplanus aerogenes]RMB13313.1 hypothetical protein ATH50_2646 [Haloplanus aerogenes]
MSGGPDEEEDSSRRRVLALLAAALLALFGAGTGNLLGGNDGNDGNGDGGFDLSVDYSVTPDEPSPTPTPDPSPSSSGGGAPNPDDAADSPEQSDTTTDGSESDPTTTDEPWRFDDPDDDRRSVGTETKTPTDTPGSDLVTSSIPPVSVSDIEPGDGGVVDLSLTLSGSPARLWVRGVATDFEEGGVVEAERSAGDTGEPGELQQYVEVRLWYDADGVEPRSTESRTQSGDGTVSDGDNLVYEGTLADLDGGDGWAPLTAACVPPGTHTARFRWDLPADAPNTVQTDGASFSLSVAADASTCE